MPQLSTLIFATVLRVIDGDTIAVNLENCNQPIVCNNVSVRIANIDTPEIHSKCPREKELGYQAKAVTSVFYPVNSRVGLTVMLDNEKYGRLLTYAPKLEETLLRQGLAAPYHGEKKTFEWCPKMP
jgi:endonuclease YncB( thermonuclease family)